MSTVITLDDTDSSIMYEGDWIIFGSSNEYMGTATYTNRLNAKATIHFRGNGITVIGSIPLGTIHRSSYLLDDGASIPRRTFSEDVPNLNSSRIEVQFFSVTGISERSEDHTLVINNERDSGALALDKIDIFRPKQPTSSASASVEIASSISSIVAPPPTSSSLDFEPPPPPTSSEIPETSSDTYPLRSYYPTSTWSARLLTMPTDVASATAGSDSGNPRSATQNTGSPSIGGIIGGLLGGLMLICSIIIIILAVKRHRTLTGRSNEFKELP